YLGMDGSVGHILEVPVDGTAGDRGPIDPRLSGISMEGQEVFRRAVTKMGESSALALEKAGLSLEDVDLLIPHQANIRIIDATARRLGVDESKVYVNIHSYGNTSAATIPVALTEALEEGRIQPGDIVVFTAFGGGLTWASSVVRWGDRVTPLGESDVELPPPDRDTMELLQPSFDFVGRPERQAGPTLWTGGWPWSPGPPGGWGDRWRSTWLPRAIPWSSTTPPTSPPPTRWWRRSNPTGVRRSPSRPTSPTPSRWTNCSPRPRRRSGPSGSWSTTQGSPGTGCCCGCRSRTSTR